MKEFNILSNVIFDTSLKEYFSQSSYQKAMIVADPMMVKLGFVETISQQFHQAGKRFSLFAEITPDPTIETISQGVWQMNQFQPDCLIAIGGGSAIDTAKGMVLANYKLSPTYQKPTLIAIPSTSGTGSEVTSFTVITNGQDKKPYVDQCLVPDVAILDVELVKTVPPKITADTGMDVLTHALEAYVSTNASVFTDALAEKAVQLVFENLLLVFRQPEDLIARQKMHEASALAGMAFTNSSLGINHSLAHAIGGIHHLSHGRINAILLPKVITYNAQSANGAKYQQLAKHLGLPAETAAEGTANLVLAIELLNEALEIESSFSCFGISEATYQNAASQIAEFALKDDCTKTNPRSVTAASLAAIYQSLY
ncbi:alcohol dehydrogenase [Enterococcus florum]|uniref:Alcohol dehydrogenase n=1 Tax=Enterococcus florum TaxID=2480627 RepID=A0A4V0WPA0_9ENTE|nr:1-propanol dehydrogenase PduQ [Enterococcus florum]GCF93129.1 alcohol dehydrogenase [Enterococcus florum]